MIYISPSEYYQLEVPDSWQIEEDNNTLSLSDINGWGAINITSYLIPEEYYFDVKKELVEFVDRQNLSIDNIVSYKVLNQFRASIDIDDGNEYWEYYVIFHNRKALFVTYNCDSEYKGREIPSIREIISSIEPI